ncbi:hypothetical protein NDU88_004047 [Pleurodeles waltl]|uniref:Uncharacterized protein n=1 Tax=Pleurodeles waltl TaxID=8319 RepID=A0AAV7W6B1_PLEWA|nr:hypothetical protein NDU88_004047 [Pleurodeles waltl]
MASRLGRVSFSRGPRFGVFWFDHDFLTVLHQCVTTELPVSCLPGVSAHDFGLPPARPLFGAQPIRAAWHPPLPVASRTQMGPMSRVVLLARGGQLNIQCSRRFQVESSNSAISDTGCLVETTRERGNAAYLPIQESHG